MNPIETPINHSDIFSSVESFLDFFSPKDVEGTDRKKCRPYNLPFWHPFYAKGQGLICGAEALEDGKICLCLSFAVNKEIPFNVSLANNWLIGENYTDSFERIAAYFVNGTSFGKDGGYFLVENGPTTFTWTYEEPKTPLCEECQSKEEPK